VRSSKRADSANPLYPKLALYEIDGSTGTRPWKVNKTRNLRFLYLFRNMHFSEMRGGGVQCARLFAGLLSKQTEPMTHVQVGIFHSADVWVQVFVLLR